MTQTDISPSAASRSPDGQALSRAVSAEAPAAAHSAGADAPAADPTRLEIVSPTDARLIPVFEDLVREYGTRYGDLPGHDPRDEVYGGAPAQFTVERRGAFLALFDGEVVVATGAARRFDDETVEFKKIWAHPERRGQGLASRLLERLEDVARMLRYRRVYLTTGPRQPEADRLYARAGYTAHFDPDRSTPHAYTKALVEGADGVSLPPGAEEVLVDFTDLVAGRAGRSGTSPDDQVAAGAAPQSADSREPDARPRSSETADEGALPASGAGDESGPAASGTSSGHTGRRVVPRRHWGRWAFAALALFIVAQFVVQLFQNPRWGWDVFAQYFLSQAVVEGLGMTLVLTAISALAGFVLGGVLAVMRMSGSSILSWLASGYIWFFRAVPLVVQLVVWYNLGYLWPTLGLGTPFTTDFWLVEFNTVQLISAFTAAILGLSLHEAAYSAEIIRGGLIAVDHGQVEASRALGLPTHVRFFRIVLPQALRSIIPNAFNSIIGLVKGTSVVFIVALPELFYTVQVIYNRNQLVIPLLLVAVVWYAIITTLLSLVQHALERHYGRGHDQARTTGAERSIRRWFTGKRPVAAPAPLRAHRETEARA